MAAMRERRVTNRFACSHLVHYRDDGDGSIGMVTDLCLDGARLRSQTPLESGGQVSLRSLDTNNGAAPVWCEVRWYNAAQREAGLCFRQSVGEILRSWVGEVLETHQSHLIQRRESVRVPVRLPVTVTEGGLTSDGLLVDLSTEGALMRCPTLWSSGTELSLELPLSRNQTPAPVMPSKPLRLKAEVIGGRCGEDGWDYSLRFTDLKARPRKSLESYISGTLN